MAVLGSIGRWDGRRYLAALVAGAGWLVLSGVPTGIIETPLYFRMTPVRWWDYPFWVAGAVLVGLLAATYVHRLETESSAGSHGEKILGGGLLSVFAIGCPVCNKLVVLALGAAGALTYFAPVQPALGFLSVGLLFYALHARLRVERSCATRVTESRSDIADDP
jgi:hypothetical protein